MHKIFQCVAFERRLVRGGEHDALLEKKRRARAASHCATIERRHLNWSSIHVNPWLVLCIMSMAYRHLSYQKQRNFSPFGSNKQNSIGRTPVVPFCFPGAFRFKSLRNKIYDFEPTTIGEHVKKKRLQLGLTQGQVAKRLGICSASVTNWENGDNQPADAPTLQRIIRLLGYDPVPPWDDNSGASPRQASEAGMGQRELAMHLKVDPKTILYWEQGGTIGQRRHRLRVAQFLGLPVVEFQEAMREGWGKMTRSMKLAAKLP